VFRDESLVFDERMKAPEWFAAIYKFLKLDYPKFYKMDNLSKLGWLAAEVLLMDGSYKTYQPEDVGIVLANKNSSLDTDIKYFETTKAVASPALFVYTLPNIVMGEISIRHRLKGESVLFVSDCFEIDFIKQYVQDLFSAGAVQSCICGWLEFFGDNAEAALYMVEKTDKGTSLLFNEENINKLYQLTNG
jgi:hypothetical protein